MFHHNSPADLRKTANQALARTRDYLQATGSDAYDTTQKYLKSARKQYPQLVAQLRDVAADKQAKLKDAIHIAGAELEHAGSSLKSGAACAKSYAIKLGLGYLVVKLYKSAELAETSRKVKSHIHAKPVESAFIALGVGYAIGKLLR